MTDPPTNFDSPPGTALPEPPPGLTPRWGRIAAGLLSLFLPGMGQLFNRQPRKALVIAIITHIFGALVAHTRLLLSFWTMVASFLVVLAWQLLVAAEAARTAARGKKPEAPLPAPWLSYPVIGAIILVSALAPSPAHTMHESGFRAHKIRSKSMCPTICVGDRIVADSWAYHAKAPERGDIVMFKHPSSEALIVKRVIGLPGDFVVPGPKGSVLVNGQAFHPPEITCGHFIGVKVSSGDSSPMFTPTKVPEGTFFVVGDNLNESLEGQSPEFSLVTLEMLRGRPLYFYWSPVRSRIACEIH